MIAFTNETLKYDSTSKVAYSTKIRLTILTLSVIVFTKKTLKYDCTSKVACSAKTRLAIPYLWI